MEDKVKVLSSNKYIAPLSYAPDGQMGATHLANVKWIDNKPGRFFVKVYPDEHNKGLVNEITGYLIAHACGLPQPSKVAVIKVPKQVITTHFKGNFTFNGDYILGWATEETGTTPNTHLNVGDMIKFNKCLEDLKRWDKLPKLLAFDNWVANQDRNTGNITIKSKNDFYLIDHGNVPVSEKWKNSDLSISDDYVNKLLKALFSDNYPLPISASMLNASKEHNVAFNNAISELTKWWGVLLDDPSKQHLEKFIEERSINSTVTIKNLTGLLVA